MGRFAGQVVFVTGGTSGIGLEASRLFVEEGAQVFVADIQERGVVEKLGADNSAYQYCDVSDPQSCEKAIKACIEKFGRLDVLFANAGVFCNYGTIIKQRVDSFQRVIQTDLNSLFYLARIGVPIMQKQGKGVIIATSSTSGLGGEVGTTPYSSAKAGLINLCKSLALELAQDNIRVNALCPGHIKTAMSAHLTDDPVVAEFCRQQVPMRRAGEAAEVAKVALFLASDDASYVTGQAFVVDGGLTAGSNVPDMTFVSQ